MLEASLIFALGVVVALLGILVQPLYDIGIVIVFIGLVGMLTRLGSWLLWLRDHDLSRGRRP